jgi:hypothetical protein
MTAFTYFFNVDPPCGLAALSLLTPGDFALVKRKASIMGMLENGPGLLEMLKQECAAKPDYQKPIGFRILG